MKVVIQRVRNASVTIGNDYHKSIEKGLMILVGITDEDNQKDIDWLTKKIVNLRVFDDEQGVMNLSIKDIGGDILLVSQFTLYASTAKGNRPSYIKAAKPEVSKPLYESLIKAIEIELNKKISTGIFGAEMMIGLTNDGPVTIIIDSKTRE